MPSQSSETRNGDLDHDLLITVRESQKSFQKEVETAFRQFTKEIYEIVCELKDTRSSVREDVDKLDKRCSENCKAIALLQMGKDSNKEAIVTLRQEMAREVVLLSKKIDDVETDGIEYTDKKVAFYIGVGSISGGVIGVVIGWALAVFT